MRKFQYIPKDKRNINSQNENKAASYASKMLKSEFNRFGNTLLVNDYQKLLNDGCFYLPNFFCPNNDRSIVNNLKKEIEEQTPITWSKHLKYENPEFSETFNKIVYDMAKHFNIKVIQTRLNYYHNNSDFKPFHHDSHAYGNKEENFTMGASFGDSRELVFFHEETNNKFSFPQNNGDVFAFNKEVNQKFMHGVPKKISKCGERFSIIAWGKQI